MEVMPTALPGQPISVDARGGEDPLPDPLPAGVGVLPYQGGRQFDPTGPGREVMSVLDPNGFEVLQEPGLGNTGEHGDPVLVALAAPDHDLVRGEVDVLDAKPATFQDPEAGTVQQRGHEARHTVKPLVEVASSVGYESEAAFIVKKIEELKSRPRQKSTDEPKNIEQLWRPDVGQ